MCGGGDAVKIVGISKKSRYLSPKEYILVLPYRGCALWSNGLGWIRCASMKGCSVIVSSKCSVMVSSMSVV